MEIVWSKYLRENEGYAPLTEDTSYIQAWEAFVSEHQQTFESQGEELILVGGNLTIEGKHMILEYLLINNKKNTIKDIEIGLTLYIQGEKQFKGKLLTPKERYDAFAPNTARIDLADFGNEILPDQVLTPKDYELVINYCKEIEI